MVVFMDQTSVPHFLEAPVAEPIALCGKGTAVYIADCLLCAGSFCDTSMDKQNKTERKRCCTPVVSSTDAQHLSKIVIYLQSVNIEVQNDQSAFSSR